MEVVAHTCNLSTEAKAGRLPLVRGQPGLQRLSLSGKKRSQGTGCGAKFVETQEHPETEPGDPRTLWAGSWCGAYSPASLQSRPAPSASR